ncbi:MAG: hypothetical protein Q4G28_09770 [Neisseria sp.]|nr:hypothetical protein [Neisseria sp.]
MKKILSVALLMVSMTTWAEPVYYVAATIPYEDESQVAPRVLNSCTRLGETFSTYLVRWGKAYGVEIKRAQKDLAEYPNRIEVTIDNARSYGNLMIGHYKQTHVDAVLYRDGEKVKAKHFRRSSIGGIAGMFKSSCGVLNRVNYTLSKDIVRWANSSADEIEEDEEQQNETGVSDASVNEVPVLPVRSGATE